VLAKVLGLTAFVVGLVAFVSTRIYISSNENAPLLTINNLQVDIEIADTPAKRERGLMHRTFLKESAGMLFVFDKPGLYSFWMKNTLIPLDIIWINEDKKIVHIAYNFQPCFVSKCPTVKSSTEALYVLEVNGGWVKRNNVKVGDLVQF
jgi:uncharacterized protein